MSYTAVVAAELFRATGDEKPLKYVKAGLRIESAATATISQAFPTKCRMRLYKDKLCLHCAGCEKICKNGVYYFSAESTNSFVKNAFFAKKCAEFCLAKLLKLQARIEF